jgi:hypothetical protein
MLRQRWAFVCVSSCHYVAMLPHASCADSVVRCDMACLLCNISVYSLYISGAAMSAVAPSLHVSVTAGSCCGCAV